MAQKKYASLTTLTNLADKIKELFVKKSDLTTELAKKANSSHTHSIADTTNLQSTLDGKVSKSGDTMTGGLTAPIFQTGSGAANYFQTRKFRGEGNADTYYHAIDLGYAGNDKFNFYEYGGEFNFYKNTGGTKDSAVLIGSITSDGFIGNATTATSATKATQDASGNTITSTYETKADATSKLDEARGYTDTLQEKLENSDIWVGQAYFASEAEYDGQGFNIVDTYERKTDANSKLTEAKNYADKKVDDEYLFSNESTGDTIIWDGNTEGLVSTPDGSYYVYYKLSDQAPTIDELADGLIFDGTEYTIENYDINEMEYGILYIGYNADIVFVPESGVNINVSGMIFPEAGTYISADIYEGEDLVLTIRNYTKYPIIKKVKKSLLPDNPLPDNVVEDADLAYFGASSKIVGKYNAVAYGNGKFVALPYRESSDSKFIYSTDGKNWTEVSAPASAYWKDVVYENGKFVAISSTSASSGYHGAVSTDGINWTATTLPSGGSPAQLAYGNGRFVLVGSNRATAWSTDGVTWTKVSFPSSGYPMGIAYGNGKFIVPTSSGKYYYSTTGTSWSEGTMITANVSDIVFDGTKFVIVGRNNAMYSTDGANWTQVSVPANANYACLAYGGGIYVALGYATNVAMYSYDGINWTGANVDVADNWGDIAYGNGVFVAGTEDGSHILTIEIGNEYGLAYQKDVYNKTEIDSMLAMGGSGSAQIATGSYIGTGEYGADNPNSLTFSFEPKLIFIHADSTSLTDTTMFMYGFGHYGSSSLTRKFVEWNGNTISWYTTSTTANSAATEQLNLGDTTYHYVAIG